MTGWTNPTERVRFSGDGKFEYVPQPTRITTTPSEATWLPKSYGWICPKCGRVWSPAVDQCIKCNDLVITINLGATP